MTIRKDETVEIPKWLVHYLIPFIVSIITGWGIYQATVIRTELKLIENEKEINKKIDKVEVDVNFINVEKALQRIENKLDKHIEQHINAK